MKRVADDGGTDEERRIEVGGEETRRKMKQENRRYREALRRC